MRRVVWRTDSRFSGSSDEEEFGRSGLMREAKYDLRVCVAPSTRTEAIWAGVDRFELICSEVLEGE